MKIVIPILLLTLMGCSTSPDNVGRIKLVSPTGGEIFEMVSTLKVFWESTNITGNLKIELLKNNQKVHLIENIEDYGYYEFLIPPSVLPSSKYQLKIISMKDTNIFDYNKQYFEITPHIKGRWFYDKLNCCIGGDLGTGILIDAFLSYSNNVLTGSGYFYFKYTDGDSLRGYDSGVNISGLVSYPLISFTLTGSDEKKINFTGEFSSYYEINGQVTGYIDSNWGSLNEQIKLRKMNY